MGGCYTGFVMTATNSELKGMRPNQMEWYRRMEATMEAIREAWCHDRVLAYELYTDKFRTDIDTACERLHIDLPTAWDQDGWDGEEDAGIITTGRKLAAIRMTKAGEEIPEYWLESYEQACERYERKHQNKRGY